MRKLSIEGKCRIIEGLVDYILQLTSASNTKGNSGFLFYQDLNGRSHKDGGSGFFGEQMYEYRDVLIVIILECKDLFIDAFALISDVLQKVLLKQLHSFGQNRGRSIRDRNQQINETGFSLRSGYINVESSSHLVLGQYVW